MIICLTLSKCIEVYEGPHTSVKWNLLLQSIFGDMLQMKIEY